MDKKFFYRIKKGMESQDTDFNKRPEIVKYYPAHEEVGELFTQLRDYGLFRDEHKDFVEEMERNRKLRGKGRFDWGKKWMKKGKHYQS